MQQLKYSLTHTLHSHTCPDTYSLTQTQKVRYHKGGCILSHPPSRLVTHLDPVFFRIVYHSPPLFFLPLILSDPVLLSIVGFFWSKARWSMACSVFNQGDYIGMHLGTLAWPQTNMTEKSILLAKHRVLLSLDWDNWFHFGLLSSLLLVVTHIQVWERGSADGMRAAGVGGEE